MPLSIVRTADTHEFVGLYAARDLDELHHLAQADNASGYFEFALMPSGALAPDADQPFIADDECQMTLIDSIPGLTSTASLMAAFCDAGLAWAPVTQEENTAAIDAVLSNSAAYHRLGELLQGSRAISLA